jgi:hypothetical protein
MIYIVTPCSRPENLNQIEESIKKALLYIGEPSENIKYRWVIVYDKSVAYPLKCIELLGRKTTKAIHYRSPHKNALVGHSHRNHFIKIYKSVIHRRENDWVYFLDDDTVLHEKFFSLIVKELQPDRTAILFNQLNADGTPRLYANHSNIKVGHIDMGQYIVNLKRIPEKLQFDENDYCADGIFIEELFKQTNNKEGFVVINEFLSHYNKLRP